VVTEVTRNEKKLASPLALLRIETRALSAEVESSMRSRMSEIPKESAVVVERIICVTDPSVALLNLSTPLPGLPELVDVENV
jgi:hypothetical protein